MIMLEIIRVHTKYQDYRNAFKVCTRLAQNNVKNPYILSRCGRLCLEIGRKHQSFNYFTAAQSLVPPDNKDTDLTCLIHLNAAFFFIYDENYT